MANLCVNIDHIATLRQARGEKFPDLIYAAKIIEKTEAVGITVHLREDRRHIQDYDVINLKKVLTKKLNLEMSINKDIVDFAQKIIPDEATIVPEKRKELTTEGGLDVIKNKTKLEKVINTLKKKGIVVSLFVDPDLKQIKVAKDLNADFIEIHTGIYSNAKIKEIENKEFVKIKKAVQYAKEIGLRVNAGHGLNYRNTKKIAKIRGIEDLNIGFSIIAHSIFVGLENAVKEMLKIIRE